MPSSMPISGIRRTAIVMACFLVKGDDGGIRPFLAALAEGTEMCKVVISTRVRSRQRDLKNITNSVPSVELFLDFPLAIGRELSMSLI